MSINWNDIKQTSSFQKIWKEFKGLISAFIFVMFIRTFIYQPFNIPSGSMIPTLLIGDYLIVSKFSYGYSHYTFPLSHIFPTFFKGRVWSSEPKRGDVIVFRNLKHDNLDYIKRLVGLPGDRIQIIKGVLHINGEGVKLKKEGTESIQDDNGRLIVLQKYIETLPNGIEHPILKQHEFGEGRLDNTPEYVVPEGHYFMMGDNRDRSADSRVMEQVGFIPFDQFIGRAEVLFFSTEAKWYEFWNWLFAVRYNRLITLIR